MQIQIKKLSADAVIPKYATALAAGFDLVATEDILIAPATSAQVPTGIAVALPPGFELQVRPRSGVSLKTKLRISNTPGTVDADYRGEIKVLIDNINVPTALAGDWAIGLDGKPQKIEVTTPLGSFVIRKGDRIAQGVIAAVEHAAFIEVNELDETDRGQGGFGHTGVK